MATVGSPKVLNPTMRVLTLNIWKREGPRQQRLTLVRGWLERLQPDLLGLQEVCDLAQLRELCGPEYHLAWMGNEGSGIAIAARWSIREQHELTLLGEGTQTGGVALRALIDAPHGPVSVCCTTTYFYLPHHAYWRERQMPQLAEFARGGLGRNDYPPILVGDFNAPPESAEIRYLKGLQSLAESSAYFVDAWEAAGDGGPGTTWSRHNDFARHWLLPNRRIDYVFVGHPRLPAGAGLVEDCQVVCNGDVAGVWPSDHFGVCATLRD
jgi:endonuclease/exonuclease/phosphatase family metal-dependent hydrolase